MSDTPMKTFSKPAILLQREVIRLGKGLFTAWEKYLDALEGIVRPHRLN